ncbi:MAG: hypothetical protein JSC189_000265 [Candidatus Tokpelaia sp. JSC189]|nr:MAG: hypothetical protein JSC189_000265 [Candidatus Tokpelaia sp. JSC189]
MQGRGNRIKFSCEDISTLYYPSIWPFCTAATLTSLVLVERHRQVVFRSNRDFCPLVFIG